MKNLIALFLIVAPLISAHGQSFTDVTQQTGLNILPGLGDVVVWMDINNDGWLDIFGASSSQVFFFKNNGNATFTDITAQTGLSTLTPRALAVADYDKDGFDDLLITSLSASDPLRIYKNTGNNSFIELNITGLNAIRAIWLDENGDGWVDIFANSGSAAFLLRNNGNGSFSNLTGAMGFNPNSGRTAAATDYNNDGLQDIYCTLEGTMNSNRFYKNIFPGGFADVTFATGVQDYRNGSAQAWGDFNDDGRMDLYIGNITSNRNVFFRNNPNGTFTDITLAAGVQDAGDARTCAWVDFNNDGLLDLLTTNHVNPNKLYRNNGNGTFTDVAVTSGISGPQDGFAVSWGDYDRDGDLDVLIAGHSYGAVLLRNDGGNAANYLNITLKGSFDNTNGIGCRLAIYYNNTVQYREINGGRGAVDQDANMLHVGLSNATQIDSILVHWPSGMIQKVLNINANQFITINQQGNVPPSVFHLIEPLPTVPCTGSSILFRWSASIDPDSANAIDYYLHIHANLHDTLIGPLSDTLAIVQTTAWMSDDSTTWQVMASDGISTRPSMEHWPLLYTYPTSIPGPEAVTVPAFRIIAVSPFPDRNFIQVAIESGQHSLLSIQISDITGKSILKPTLAYLVPGKNQLRVEARGMAPGIYFLRLETKNLVLCHKIAWQE